MSILSRYVLRNFLRYLFLALLTLVFIYVVINLFDNLGRYLARNVLFKDVLLYYAYLVPSYTVLLIPIASIIGAFFVFGFMTKHREIIALKASGFDLNRFVVLILGVGLMISALVFVFQETVGTWAQTRLFEHKSARIDKRDVKILQNRRNFFYYGDNNWIYSIKYYDGGESIMRNVVLWQVSSEQRILKRIDAESGQYDGVWRFRNVVMRQFDSFGNETVTRAPLLALDELNEKPADFLRRVKPIEEMNVGEISQYVHRRSRAGEDVSREEVEFHYRFSLPLITIVVLLICLPLSLTLKRGGIAIGIGVSIVIAFLYWGFIQSCRAYGAAGLLTPIVAAWLPNAAFGAVGIAMMLGVRR